MKLFTNCPTTPAFNLCQLKFGSKRLYLVRHETLVFDNAWMESTYSIKGYDENNAKGFQVEFPISSDSFAKYFQRSNLIDNDALYVPEDFRPINSKSNSEFRFAVTASKLFFKNGERMFRPGLFFYDFKAKQIREDPSTIHLIEKISETNLEKNWSFFPTGKQGEFIIILRFDPFKAYLVRFPDQILRELTFVGELPEVSDNHYEGINYSLSGNLIPRKTNNFLQLIKTKDRNNFYFYSLAELELRGDAFHLVRYSKPIFGGHKLFICSAELKKNSILAFGGIHDQFPIKLEVPANQI